MNVIILAFIKGLIFGTTITLIPGPIFFLIVQRTLNEGIFIGFLCGLGTLAADVLYALIAAVGLNIVTHYLLNYQNSIVFLGGLFLVYLGVTTYFKKIEPISSSVIKKIGKYHAFFSSFFLTLTNPISIVSFTVIFAGLDVASNSLAMLLLLLFGVVVGSLLILILQIGFLAYFREKFSLNALVLINKISGALLVGFGIVALGRGLVSLLLP